MRAVLQTLFVLASVLVAGCRGAGNERADRPAPEPVGAEPGPESAPAEPPAPRVGDLAFRPQPGWFEEEPASAMRAAQYRLPRAQGDPVDATLVVYHFGEGGGSVEDNLNRWCDQVLRPDGGDARAVAWIRELTVAGRPAHDLDVSGTYVAETFPGSGERLSEAGWRLRATIVESSAGRCYLKLVGPEGTVALWGESYEAFLRSLDGAVAE